MYNNVETLHSMVERVWSGNVWNDNRLKATIKSSGMQMHPIVCLCLSAEAASHCVTSAQKSQSDRCANKATSASDEAELW